MKRTIALFSAVFMAATTFAQDKKECKADMLADTPGAVIQKEYVNITVMDHLTIVVEFVTNTANNQKLSALDMEYKTGGDDGTTSNTLLDADEVDALLAFMQNIQDNISKTTAPKNYTEYTFLSKSGFEAGCYWDKKWKTYFKVDSEDSKTDMELDNEDMTKMMSFIRQAKSKM